MEALSPVLRVKNVRKLYGALEAIRNVSLDVAANEFVSILGPSGCGKSTLLMMVAGVVDKSAGEIQRHARLRGRIWGWYFRTLRKRKKIGQSLF
jgi:ABC-type Fe3+/spermidine/putrescine transport system ATPase subunit